MKAEWTWLIYMAGDNNLEGAGREDMKEMQKVGSTDQVKILVQFDTEKQRTTRYLMTKGKSKTLQTMPGVDCGDPAVLTDFICWGAQEFPANRYGLVVWNHGGGWEDVPVDYDANRALKPRRLGIAQRARRGIFRTTLKNVAAMPFVERLVAIDCGAQDYLDNQELRKAVENGKIIFDVFGCDACLMNMVEIAYEMKDVAKFMVGSEETEPGAGWPYTEIFGAVTKTPAMETAKVASRIVDEYGKWYKTHNQGVMDAVTQSALDLAKVPDLAVAVDQLAGAMIAAMPTIRGQIAYTRASVVAFEEPDYIDLGDFTSLLKDNLAGAAAGDAVRAAAQKVLDAINGTIIANATLTAKVARAKGVSIHFPSNRNKTLLDQYAKLLFGQHHKWGEFLKAYCA